MQGVPFGDQPASQSRTFRFVQHTLLKEVAMLARGSRKSWVARARWKRRPQFFEHVSKTISARWMALTERDASRRLRMRTASFGLFLFFIKKLKASEGEEEGTRAASDESRWR